jgi:GT2 family glycosyltransferase
MSPKVGIIYLTFPTKNWERDIDGAMKSFEKLDYPKESFELICVESKGSRPSVKEWFEKIWMPKSGTTLPRIQYIFNDREIGFSGNNNLGFELAKQLDCEYVHLINEDTFVDPACVSAAVACAEADKNIGAVQSLILLGEEPDKINSTGNAFHYLGFGYSNDYKKSGDSAPTSIKDIGYASGAAVLVRVSAVDGQLFDEGFFSYHEDTDLSLRLRLKGYRIVIEPKSVLWHYYEFGKAKINYYWMERNRYALVFSYYRLWTLFLIFPMLLVMDLATSLFSMRGDWWEMKRKVYGDLFSSKFWKWIGERRRSIKSVRKVGDRALLKLAVGGIEFQEDAVRNPLLEYVGNPVMKIFWAIARLFLI